MLTCYRFVGISLEQLINLFLISQIQFHLYRTHMQIRDFQECISFLVYLPGEKHNTANRAIVMKLKWRIKSISFKLTQLVALVTFCFQNQENINFLLTSSIYIWQINIQMNNNHFIDYAHGIQFINKRDILRFALQVCILQLPCHY